MNNSRNTVSALFVSAFSVLLCFSVFIGSTLAWFSSSTADRNNKISVGNLDITLYDEQKEAIVDDSVLFDDIVWKPGTVAYENLTVQNEGNLAFKYRISFKPDEFNTVLTGRTVSVSDTETTQEKSLKDVLKVAVVEGHIKLEEEITDADAVRTAVLDKVNSAGINLNGSQEEVSKWADIDSFAVEEHMDAPGTESAEEKITVVIYWEPSENDNDYNSKLNKTSDGKPLFMKLGMKFEAAQAASETDSFGKIYDEGALYESETGEDIEEADGEEDI